MEGTLERIADSHRAEVPDLRSLFSKLGADDPVKVRKSASMLVDLGPGRLPNYVNEALSKRRSIRFRMRMLDVIERIGHPLPPEWKHKLSMGLVWTRSAKLAAKIFDVMLMHQQETKRRQNRARKLIAARINRSNIV